MSVDPFGTIRAQIIDIQGKAVGGQPSNNDWRFTVDNEQLKFQHYDSSANIGNGCTYAEEYYDCDGNCLVDTDGDGTCDELEIEGCTDSTAFNYDTSATEDDVYSGEYELDS